MMSNDRTVITPAERIRELSAINNDVSSLLSAAGQAVQALTGKLSMSDDLETAAVSADEGEVESDPLRRAFKSNTRSFFITLQSICARLNRQAYALEEAGIIAADVPILTLADAAKPSAGRNATATDVDKIKNGGLGNFDVGWLNSRGNKVGAEKEAEIMKDLKALLEKLVADDSDRAGYEDQAMDLGS